MGSRFALAGGWLGVLLIGAALVGACNNQGEGQVCDPNANNGGNDDCQSGFTCVQAPGVAGTPNPYRCCPSSGATAAVCNQSSHPFGEVDAAAEGGAADAPSEAASDGAVTPPPDAPAEAASDAAAMADASSE